MQYYAHIDLKHNQLKNALFHLLESNPTDALSGTYYFNMQTKKIMYYDGTLWHIVGDEYTLPVATDTTLGGVKSGGDITINSKGIMSVNDNSHNHIASNITNLASTVKTYRLDEFADPTSDISMNSHKITNLANGTANTDAVNKGQLDSAISELESSLTGALIYKGSIPTTTVPNNAEKGWYYVVSTDGTYYGIECNAGDMLIVNKNLSGTPTASDFDKIDNTESADLVKLNEAQTLTNKTIDADNNTITNLDLDNFKAGVILQKYSGNNPALTSSNGYCTWTVTHNRNSTNLSITLKRISDNVIGMATYTIVDNNSITVQFLSNTDIVADTYNITII